MDEMRIETEASFMLDIMRDVKSGAAVPASFQRPFVWGAQDVEALWTSILRGYPLGAFLLWRPKDGIIHSRSTLGPIPLDPSKRASIILDGQNRLVTIAWSMTNPDETVADNLPGSNVFRSGKTLVLDPHERRARFVSPEEISGMIMPVHHLFGTLSAFLRTAWRSDDDNEAMDWLDRAGERLRTARIVRTTIVGATTEEAREAFLHVARAGVPMSRSDFDAAMAFNPGSV